jgi:hypothetical protein
MTASPIVTVEHRGWERLPGPRPQAQRYNFGEGVASEWSGGHNLGEVVV